MITKTDLATIERLLKLGIRPAVVNTGKRYVFVTDNTVGQIDRLHVKPNGGVELSVSFPSRHLGLLLQPEDLELLP